MSGNTWGKAERRNIVGLCILVLFLATFAFVYMVYSFGWNIGMVSSLMMLVTLYVLFSSAYLMARKEER